MPLRITLESVVKDIIKYFDCRRLKYLMILLSTYVLIQVLTRIVILVSFSDLVSNSILESLKTLAVGLIYDFTSGVCFCLPVALLLIFLQPKSRLLTVTLFILDFLTLFIAVALFLFWQEFHTNFNFIAVDYLIYTHEMLGNIWQSFNVMLIMPIIFVITLIIFMIQKTILPESFNSWQPLNFIIYIVLIVMIPASLVYFVKSEWRENVSSNRHNVEVSGNGAYEFVRAFFTNEIDYQTFYLTQDDSTVINTLRKLIDSNNSTFLDNGVTRQVDNHNEMSELKPNVVLITVESLNADYSAVFGANNSLTPHLDELAKDSFIFKRMYATGTRTVRGLEALNLSLPPTPGQSILRRANNDDLASLGNAFRQNGYNCDFIYGGYGYFDNMNEFFAGNGYTVKDRTSIPDEEIFHETIWGVADEILFTQVLKSMDEHFSNGERAFEMVMTTSNHRPFTFPADRVDMPDGTRPAAVLYTDWAIDDFLKRASTKPWFDNTIFVIIADHQALAAGKASLPINCYHIPCLIYAPKLINPGSTDRLISQVDLAPTLLGIIGMSYKSKFLGHDINRTAPEDDRVFISTYQMLGYIKNDTLIVLTPDKKITPYHIKNWNTSDYSQLTADDLSASVNNSPIPVKFIIDEAIAYYQGASYLFKNNLLKMTEKKLDN